MNENFECPYCGDDYPAARAEIGRPYCMKDKCVSIALSERKFVEVGYGKSGVELRPSGTITAEELKNTGNRGR